MLGLGKAANVEIAKFVHAEEVAFLVKNRRNKQLGLWLAAQLGSIEDAMDYAQAVVAFGVAEPDDDALVRFIQDELALHGVRMPEAAIRFESDRQTTLAKRSCTMLQPSQSVVH